MSTMTEQEIEECEKRTTIGIVHADEGADVLWKEAALNEALILAISCEFFTAHDVTQRMEKIGIQTKTPAAMGPLFLRLAKAGYIAQTGRYTKAYWRVGHTKHVTLWRSLIYSPSSELYRSDTQAIVEAKIKEETNG